MTWIVGILLAVALSVESYSVTDQYEELAHGRQLRIFLPKGSQKLEFSPADNPSKTFECWKRGTLRTRKGKVSGSGKDHRWYIDQVTYEDQGTYILRDFSNKKISAVRLVVTSREIYKKCVAGESLQISLEGLPLVDALLSFSRDAGNVTLVRNGSRVSQDLRYYFDRVRTTNSHIEVRNVKYRDVGRYTLRDRRRRVVSVTRMDLTDHHEPIKGSPLLSLLLLLVIPACIGYCCRKKIFRSRASAATVLQTILDAVPPPPAGPVGPSPPCNVEYHGPDATMGPTVHPPPPTTGPVQWSGLPPSAGFNPAYPPYPPGPAVIPPGQPPQWNGQYPVGPVPPMGYAPAPVMYSSPPPPAVAEPLEGSASEPSKEEVRVETVASSPAEPLLPAAPQAEAASPPVAPLPPSSINALTSSDASYQFQINGKDSTSFL